MEPQVGQRWWWAKPDSHGQRLVVEIIQVTPHLRGRLLQRMQPNDPYVHIAIGTEFDVIITGWEYLPGQDSPNGH